MLSAFQETEFLINVLEWWSGGVLVGSFLEWLKKKIPFALNVCCKVFWGLCYYLVKLFAAAPGLFICMHKTWKMWESKTDLQKSAEALTKLPQERFLLSHILLIGRVCGGRDGTDFWCLAIQKEVVTGTFTPHWDKKKKVTDCIPLGNTIFSANQEVPPSDNLHAANEVLYYLVAA